VRSSRSDRAPDGDPLVAAKVVEQDDVSRLQCWHKELLDPGAEDDTVDGAVDDAWRINPIGTQRGEERHGGPTPVRHARDEPLAARRPAVRAGHVRLGPRFIDEHEAAWIDPTLMPLPAITFADDVRPGLFGGVQAFF